MWNESNTSCLKTPFYQYYWGEDFSDPFSSFPGAHISGSCKLALHGDIRLNLPGISFLLPFHDRCLKIHITGWADSTTH